MEWWLFFLRRMQSFSIKSYGLLLIHVSMTCVSVWAHVTFAFWQKVTYKAWRHTLRFEPTIGAFFNVFLAFRSKRQSSAQPLTDFIEAPTLTGEGDWSRQEWACGGKSGQGQRKVPQDPNRSSTGGGLDWAQTETRKQFNSVNGATWQGGRVMGRRGAGVEMDRRAAHGPQTQEQVGHSQLSNVEY